MIVLTLFTSHTFTMSSSCVADQGPSLHMHLFHFPTPDLHLSPQCIWVITPSARLFTGKPSLWSSSTSCTCFSCLVCLCYLCLVSSLHLVSVCSLATKWTFPLTKIKPATWSLYCHPLKYSPAFSFVTWEVAPVHIGVFAESVNVFEPYCGCIFLCLRPVYPVRTQFKFCRNESNIIVCLPYCSTISPTWWCIFVT